MNRLTGALILLPLIALFSCDTNSKAHTETTKDSVAVISFDLKAWMKGLPVLQKPVDMYALTEVTGRKGPFPFGTYKAIFAGIVNSNKQYITLIARGVFPGESSSESFLFTFTPEGKEIARERVGLEKEDTINNVINVVRLWPVIDNDSLFAVKEDWQSYKKDATGVGERKASMKLFRIGKDGRITPVQQETDSFEGFAARFNTISLPATIGKPDLPRLKRLSFITPYYNFADYIYYDNMQLFHYGKMQVPGNGMYLLYATGLMDYEDAVVDTSVQLVACTAKGRETDRLMVFGTEGAEGYYTRTYNCSVAADGSITLTEETPGYNEYMVFYLEGQLIRQLAFRLNGEGKFVKQLKGLEYAAADLEENAIRKALVQMAKDGAKEHTMDDFLFRVNRENSINVRLHIYNKDKDQLAELYTVTTDNQVLDRYVIYNDLKKADYQQVAAKDGTKIEGEEMEAGEEKLEGPAAIRLKGKLLAITPEGKFQEQ